MTLPNAEIEGGVVMVEKCVKGFIVDCYEMAEIKAERNDLLAKVDKYKKALDKLSGMIDCHECPFGAQGSERCVANTCASLPKWAMSDEVKDG